MWAPTSALIGELDPADGAPMFAPRRWVLHCSSGDALLRMWSQSSHRTCGKCDMDATKPARKVLATTRPTIHGRGLERVGTRSRAERVGGLCQSGRNSRSDGRGMQHACTAEPTCVSASWNNKRVKNFGVESQCWLSKSCRVPNCCYSGWSAFYAKRRHDEPEDAGTVRRKPSESCGAQSGKPPSLAVCVLGSARSFASPLLLASLRQQFVDPLSGGSDSTTRLFALIKTRDDRKAVGGNTATHGGVGQYQSFQQHVDATATISSLASALESEWVMPLLAEAVIVDGSGGYDGVGWAPTDAEREACRSNNASGSIARQAIRRPDDALWQSHRPPDDSCRVLRRNTANLDATLNDRMVKNLLSFKWCFGAIERYEMASGKPFEVVAYTRPDMLRLEPMRPWCEWTNLRTHVVTCPFAAHDGYFVAPRHDARQVLAGQLEAYNGCNDSSSWYNVRGPRTKVPASCCFGSEAFCDT